MERFRKHSIVGVARRRAVPRRCSRGVSVRRARPGQHRQPQRHADATPPGACSRASTVICKNLRTGLTQETVTNEVGIFRFADLPIGQYEVTATLQGFQKLVAGGINLITGQSADLKLAMQPGGLETTVEVSGATPVVQTSSSTVQTSMTVRQVQELPLNGRNPLQLVALTAGASITAPGASVAGQQDGREPRTRARHQFPRRGEERDAPERRHRGRRAGLQPRASGDGSLLAPEAHAVRRDGQFDRRRHLAGQLVAPEVWQGGSSRMAGLAVPGRGGFSMLLLRKHSISAWSLVAAMPDRARMHDAVRGLRPGQQRQPERYADRLHRGRAPRRGGHLQEPPHGSDAGNGHERGRHLPLRGPADRPVRSDGHPPGVPDAGGRRTST